MIFRRHRSKVAVKAYLLGALAAREATQLEQRYFSDPAFLAWIRTVEAELIEEYVRGRLPAESRQRFERRYLELPALRKRFDEVRAGLAVEAPRQYVRWRLVLVGAVAICCIGGCFAWWRAAESSRVMTARNRAPAPEPIVLAVTMAPGISKSAESTQVEIAPPAGGRVRITFKLPGLRRPADCQVALTPVDGGPGWSRAGLRSASGADGQQVTVEIDSASLPAADYLARLLDAAGNPLETYSFRVAPRP